MIMFRIIVCWHPESILQHASGEQHDVKGVICAGAQGTGNISGKFVSHSMLLVEESTSVIPHEVVLFSELAAYPEVICGVLIGRVLILNNTCSNQCLFLHASM
jgi:hypothetical protein